MPQLKSGRYVGLAPSPLLALIKFGSDTSVSAAIIAYRLSISSPQQLRDYLTIAYYRQCDENPPPDALSYDSGFLVKDVLEGKADWSEDEIREFDNWLTANPKVEMFLTEQFDKINTAIRDSVVWTTPLWTDDESEEPDQ